MELLQEIKLKIETKIQNKKISQLNPVFNSLSENYKTNTGNSGEHILNEDYALVYCVSRLPATFKVVSSVFEKMEELGLDDVNSILDIGAGMATATIASLYSFEIESAELVERNKNMIDMGNFLLEDYDLNYHYNQTSILNFDTQNKYNLVVASYVLSELKEKERNIVLEKMWNFSDKYIVITDTGTPQGYENLVKIKEFFITKDASIVYPCPCKNCPLNNDWCHFKTRVARTKIHKLVKNADSPFEDEKYTCLIVSKTNVEPVENVVLRHPIIEEKSVKLKLCTKDKIIETTITKNNPLYRDAKKLKTGDTLKDFAKQTC